MKTLWLISFVVLLFGNITAQGLIVPYGDPQYDILDRWDVLFPEEDLSPFITSVKNYQRAWISQRAMKTDSMNHLGELDLFDLTKILLENDEWKRGSFNVHTNNPTFLDTTDHSQFNPDQYMSKKPILRFFYRSPAHLIAVNQPAFTLRINPIIQFKYGAEQGTTLFENQRGIEVRGGIDDKIFFHSRILESQSKFPRHVEEYIENFSSLPGNGLYKSYSSNIFQIDQGYDYLNADAFVGFNFTRHVGAQLGYGKQFIGNGLRSLFLSEFANNYFFLRLNTQIWKIHFQNLFGEINGESPNFRGGDELIPKKYFAAHYLGIKLSPNFDIGLFETVIFSRDQFELQYLNPIILYRSVEQNLGSPDNVLIGLDLKWNLWRKLSLYGQIVFDEFKLNELITNNRGWWANKYGIQLGLKMINVMQIDHLDAQIEFNSIRPYTYSHGDSTSNYAHVFQSLAHPLGSNLREVLIRVSYQPINRITLSLLYWSALKGNDDQQNWGGNVLLPNNTRVNDFGNEIGQGLRTNYRGIYFSASYELFHDVYLDLDLNSRTQNDKSSFFFTTGLRMNLGKRRRLF